MSVALLGFAVDEGVRRNNGRVGATGGPDALRAALKRIPVIAEASLTDLGNVQCTDRDLESAQAEHAARVEQVVRDGSLALCIGGGHEIAFATAKGILAARPDARRVLVINIDAHFDVRMASQSTSGTSFRQIHELCTERNIECAYRVFGISAFSNSTELFTRAQQMQARWWRDDTLQDAAGTNNALSAIAEELQSHDVIHLSVCLDVLPGGQAPGVSAPAALGVPLAQVERLVDAVLASGRVAAVDIAELNPVHDRDGLTARVAARLAARIISRARGIVPAP